MPTSTRSRLFDLAVCAVVLAATAFDMSVGRSPVVGAIGLAMAAALLVRRRHPLWTGGIVFALGLLQVVLAYTLSTSETDMRFTAPVLFDLAVLVAVHALAKYTRHLWQALLACAGGLFAALLVSTFSGPHWWRQALLLGAVATAAWTIGFSARTHRLYIQGLEERNTALQRERLRLAEAAAASERERIAREMHDVIAHALAGMIAQVDGASYAIDASPDQARRALLTAGDSGRRALAELQQLLAVLREPAEPGPRRRPLDVDRLDELAVWAKTVGLDPAVHTTGDTAALPVGVALAVHRIVQEALTNTLKHAGPGTHVTVDVHAGSDATGVEITDDGNGRPLPAVPDDGGHGLAGMRERVAVYGGEFTAGPRPGGGWRVTALIPTPSQPTPEPKGT
ncbi:sensor histidine kinase [Phytomonospora endophytica]|uniref:histidine kinase n=1 Tax=Phytomonospora endophytica TaxID=714109 RepID=A0A841FFH2_9ACTN|nr:sensor histidine kinase [Phytomonospora endophytica]MBB6034594.1 signal transduction histidine kinase [Phytomonospora endophytica]GIG71346.1 two-component sensor histidine kinase [Phytomonospora endophytica]